MKSLTVERPIYLNETWVNRASSFLKWNKLHGIVLHRHLFSLKPESQQDLIADIMSRIRGQNSILFFFFLQFSRPHSFPSSSAQRCLPISFISTSLPPSISLSLSSHLQKVLRWTHVRHGWLRIVIRYMQSDMHTGLRSMEPRETMDPSG